MKTIIQSGYNLKNKIMLWAEDVEILRAHTEARLLSAIPEGWEYSVKKGIIAIVSKKKGRELKWILTPL